MNKLLTKNLTLIVAVSFLAANLRAQAPQGFFLDSWEPRNITLPDFNDVAQTTNAVNVSVKVDFTDTVTKVSKYLFGDNANAFTTSMSENKTLMKYMSDRDMGVLRGPSGSISDVYFWNRYDTDRPSDIPAKLAGSTDAFSPWYGKRQSWANWSMDIDSFYHILDQVKATGMITVNYGYARYGTSSNPVAAAAHLAADWVRCDKGRSKFWEIGNEVFGNWEAGYRIDKTLNKDNQPEYINGTLYGQHCLVFIDSMKKAATEIGVDIKIGAVVVEENNTSNGWNEALFAVVGDKIDFYSVHSYFTPYNQNSTAAVVLNSYSKASEYKTFIWNGLQNKSKPKKPVALTEYNIFAIGSKQPVSHTNGLHAVLVVGEAMRSGYGASLRWDLANGWDNGNDHGMFSYGNEPDVAQFSPRPAFYTMFYFRRYMGDAMVRNTVTGSPDIVAFASKFSSGQASVVLVNKGHSTQTVRVNIENFKFGDRYYTYMLTGGTDNGDFSRKTYVNGIGNSGVAGGPLNYGSIKAKSSSIDTEIKVEVPALSMLVLLADKGEKTLLIDETYTPTATKQLNSEGMIVRFFPVPVKDILNFEIKGADFQKIELTDVSGKKLFSARGSFAGSGSIPLNLKAGIYLIKLEGKNHTYSSKITIE